MPIRNFHQSVQNVIDQTTHHRPSTATVHSIEDERVNITLGGSSSLIRSVRVIGDLSGVSPGDVVDIIWNDERPVVLLGGSGGTAQRTTASVAVDGKTLERSYEGLRVKKGGIGMRHLNFAPVTEGHTHPDPLADAGWKVSDAGVLYNKSTYLHPDGEITLGASPNVIKLSGDAPYRIWAGASNGAYAPFSVDKDGKIVSTAGQIGGWNISQYAMRSDVRTDGGYNAEINSLTPHISLGGATYLSGEGFWVGKHGSVYRLKIGGSSRYLQWDGINLLIQGSVRSSNFVTGLAGWNIDVDGDAELSNATVRGHIEALTGAIGGWDIYNDRLESGAVKLNSAVPSIAVGATDYNTGAGFWVGDYGSGNYRMRIGDSDQFLTWDGANLLLQGSIKSANYIEDVVGWSIDNAGDAEFNNVIIRGAIKAAILEYEHIIAVSGGLIITKTSALVSEAFTAGSSNFVVKIKIPDGFSSSGLAINWTAGDVVRVKNGLQNFWGSIVSTSDQTTHWEITVSRLDPAFDQTFGKGVTLVNYGASGDGAIEIDGQETRIRLFTHTGTPYSSVDNFLIIGDLDNHYGFTGQKMGFGVGDPNKINDYFVATEDGIEMSGTINIVNGVDWADINDPPETAQYFYQATAPTSGMNTGDYWIDSDNNLLHRYDGVSWVAIQDTEIDQALTDASQAISDAATAQATADGKVTTYYQSTQPTAEALGDLWIDTSTDRLYRWDGAAWVEIQDADIAQAISDAATAQSTADSKIVTFYQTTAPTADGVGDLWVDTDDANRLYRWSGSSWVDVHNTNIDQALADAQQAITDAATAQATADGKVTTFYQSTQPTAEALGDLWIDTSTDRLYRWDGSVWSEIQDADIAQAISDAADAQSTADSKIVTFYEATAPTADGVGDLWVDTDDGNRLYRWDGTSWVDVHNTDIDQALSDAQTAIDDAATAQATADGKVTTFYQSTAPTADGDGDLWVDTDTDRLYRWSESTATWVEIQDADIAQAIADAGTAQSTADSKIVTFYQTTAPSGEGEAYGDLWVDTDNGNRLYRYNGTSWDDVHDTEIDTALADAQAALSELSDIGSDLVLTPTEKRTAYEKWQEIVKEGNTTDGSLRTQAVTLGIATTDFDTAYSTLDTYLNDASTGLLNDLTTSSNITRTTWNTNWGTYFFEKAELVNAVASYADWNNVNNIPERLWEYDELNPPAGAGLFFSSSHLGYYDGGAWKTFIGSNGDFMFKGNDSNIIHWDGNQLNIKGGVIIGSGSGFTTTALLHLPFDGGTPYETDFHVNTNGHLGQQATLSGGVIGRPGKFGKAVQVAEATTNLIANPIFENNVSDDYSWSSANWTHDTSRSFIGNASAKFVSTVGSTPSVRIGGDFTVPDGGWITVQVRFYVEDSPASDAQFGLYDATNSIYRGFGYASKLNEWEQVVFSWQNNTGASVNYRVYLRNHHSEALPIWVDAVQVELKPYPTPLAVGNMGNGHSWSGTAHNSVSNRSNPMLYYSLLAQDEGSISMWVKPTFEQVAFEGTYAWLAEFIEGSENFLLYIHAAGTLRFNTPGTDIVHDFDGDFAQNEWHHIVATWDYPNNTTSLWLDGVLLGSGEFTLKPDTTSITIGVRNNYSYAFPGYIDDFAILDHALTADEVQSIYESDAPLNVPTSNNELMLTGAGQGKVWGHAGGLFATDANGNGSFALINQTMNWEGGSYVAGNVVIGDPNGQHLSWDGSTLSVTGDITVVGDTSTTVDWSDIVNKPNELLSPTVAGLYLSSTKMGYYTGSAWTTYIENNGDFYFKGSSGHLMFDASQNKLLGSDGTNTQWYADANDGKLYAGGGQVSIDKDGILMSGSDVLSGQAYLSWADTLAGVRFLKIGGRSVSGVDYGYMDLKSGSNTPKLSITSDGSGSEISLETTYNRSVGSYITLNYSSGVKIWGELELSMGLLRLKTGSVICELGEIRQGTTDYGGYEIQTGGQIYAGDYGIFMGGVHIGGTSDPGTDRLLVDDYGIFMGGVHVGGTSDPGTGRLVVDGHAAIGGAGVSSAHGLTIYGPGSTTSTYGLVVANSSGGTYFWVNDAGSAWLSGSLAQNSDISVKENIVSLAGSGIDKISRLSPVKFDYIDGEKNQLGFIAQDVQEVIPEVISKNTAGDGTLGIQYSSMIPYLVKAIQELQAEIETLKV